MFYEHTFENRFLKDILKIESFFRWNRNIY